MAQGQCVPDQNHGSSCTGCRSHPLDSMFAQHGFPPPRLKRIARVLQAWPTHRFCHRLRGWLVAPAAPPCPCQPAGRSGPGCRLTRTGAPRPSGVHRLPCLSAARECGPARAFNTTEQIHAKPFSILLRRGRRKFSMSCSPPSKKVSWDQTTSALTTSPTSPSVPISDPRRGRRTATVAPGPRPGAAARGTPPMHRAREPDSPGFRS